MRCIQHGMARAVPLSRSTCIGPVCLTSYVRPNNMRKPTPREKRLLLLAAILVCIVPFAPMLNSQLRHLRQVRAHIGAVAPQWEAFQRQNPGFESVQLFAYTGGDGMFGAAGHVPTHGHVQMLKAFMERSSPPRPIFVGAVQIVDQEAIGYLKAHERAEPDGAANRSQPVTPGTNRTSAAAGSGR